MLKIRDLHASYGKIRALKGVDLHVGEGELVTLIGANGAGKSTLLKSISGLHRPSSGVIEFMGEEIQGRAPERIVRMGLVQVPEGRAILGRMTVLENLQMGSYCRSDKTAIARDLEGVCGRFPILAKRRRQLAGTLSGGEQQMLAIGRALMARPRLLMLDEPSLGLAPLVVAEIFRIIQELLRERITILLVEQNAKKALQCADRGYVLETGNLVLEGAGFDLLHSQTVQEAYLGVKLPPSRI